MNIKAKLISMMILIAFLGAGVFSFVHSMGMIQGDHHAADCTLGEGPQDMCSTSPIEHLTYWQKAINYNFKTFADFLLPLIVVGILILYRFIADNYSASPRARRRTFEANLPINLYTRIFSEGILNPKAP